ncbi:MAG: GDSL-type esterase/lipase family protein, partial [Lentisphaeria bacterium]
WKNETVPPVSREKFSGHLCHFINRLREYSAFPILMTPNPLFWTPELLGYYGKPPYDRNDPNGLNLMLSPYADEVRLICSQYGIPLVDVYMIFNKLDIRKLLLDGMHPNDEGHAIVAEELFKLIVA